MTTIIQAGTRLTPEQAADVRAALARGMLSHRQVAEQAEVDRSFVSRVIRQERSPNEDVARALNGLLQRHRKEA